jgi:hypothetical protein
MSSLKCFREPFLSSLSLTLSKIVGHATILFVPSLIGLRPSYTATLLLLDTNYFETCSNYVHTPQPLLGFLIVFPRHSKSIGLYD